jgi:Xaa-Pro aminopeptidase
MIALIDIADGGTMLFGDETSMDDMIWTGPKPSLAEAAATSGIDRVMPYSLARDKMAKITRLHLHYPPLYRGETLLRLSSLLEARLEDLRNGYSPALVASIIALREIKEDREVSELEKAVAVSAEMHCSLLSELRPGWTEAEAAAHVQHIAARQGCDLSFATIATVHGEVLHNHERVSICREGDSFLLDAGAESPSGYAGDLTTSFPVGPRFAGQNAELYDILLDMFKAATAALKPGILFLDAHMAASLALARGFRALGIMKGNPEEAVRHGAHALFFPHGLGHMIGLDVHDMEGMGEDNVGYAGMERSRQFGLRSLRLAKALKPGMVHSVEPGIYFIPGLVDKWESEGLASAYIDYTELSRWRHCGGMRIEEDWLVMEDGCRRLGPFIDKSRKAIEIARSQR